MRALLAAAVLAPLLAGCSITVEKASSEPAPVVSEVPASPTPSPSREPEPVQPATPLDLVRRNALSFSGAPTATINKMADLICKTYRMTESIDEAYRIVLVAMEYDAKGAGAMMGYAAAERCPRFAPELESWGGAG